MTIAAGFRCKDGVVLCSDTQITQVGGKSHESKIFSINPQAESFLVYAGYVGFIKEFVGDLKKIVAHEKTQGLVQQAKVHYRRFHNKHYTQAPKAERAFADIILTVRENGKIALYAGSGRAFYPVDNYESFGSGKPVAEPFFASFDFKQMSVGEAANAAIYTLWRIRDFAENVGGKTKILTVEDECIFPLFPADQWTDEEVREVEKDYQYLDEQIRPMNLVFPSIDPDRLARWWRSIGIDLKRYATAQKRKAEQEREKAKAQIRRETEGN